MKVTTDGCLFGAIVAKEISKEESCKGLDIGAGTGLLSLMVAQENKEAVIDAVEIDKAAAEQAKENVAASPWNSKINVLQSDIVDYQSTELYDVIISNPPFYEKQLASPNEGRKLAHHSSELSLQQLFQQVKKLLKADGKFYVMLPFYRREEMIATAKNNELFVEKQWLVKQTPKHLFFRTIFCFGDKETDEKAVELIIKDEQQQYTDAFIKLLQPFYLHL